MQNEPNKTRFESRFCQPQLRLTKTITKHRHPSKPLKQLEYLGQLNANPKGVQTKGVLVPNETKTSPNETRTSEQTAKAVGINIKKGGIRSLVC